MADATDRLGRLRSVKLHALVADHLGRPFEGAPGVFPPGAAASDGDVAWVLVEDQPERGLGRALAWATRNGARQLHLLAERSSGALARQATHVTMPVSVWHVEGRDLLPAVPEPLSPPRAATAAHLALIPSIEDGGATPVIEHGVVAGEVRGLEVCRVVDDAATGAVRLEVGVGVHDREAFAIIHGDRPATEALAGVVDAVATYRSPDAPPHPLHRLAPERLLRWQLEQDPSGIGLTSLTPAQPPVPRPNVKDRVPCSAVGVAADGTKTTVVCSVGVDLDLIPYAIDARLAAPGAEVMMVLPERDLVPITVELAALVERPMVLVPFPG